MMIMASVLVTNYLRLFILRIYVGSARIFKYASGSYKHKKHAINFETSNPKIVKIRNH